MKNIFLRIRFTPDFFILLYNTNEHNFYFCLSIVLYEET